MLAGKEKQTQLFIFIYKIARSGQICKCKSGIYADPYFMPKGQK